MNPKEQEIRDQSFQTPFIPFTLVTFSGERLKVITGDHIKFSPKTDEEGNRLPEDQSAKRFILYGMGSRHRIVFFDAVSRLDVNSDKAMRG
jgi:hypothetical protein